MRKGVLAFFALIALYAVPAFADDDILPEIAPVEEAAIPPLDAPAEE